MAASDLFLVKPLSSPAHRYLIFFYNKKKNRDNLLTSTNITGRGGLNVKSPMGEKIDLFNNPLLKGIAESKGVTVA